MKKYLLSCALILSMSTAAFPQNWPEKRLTEADRQAAAKEALKYPKINFSTPRFEYFPDGPYLDYTRKSYSSGGRLKLDAAGLPMVKYGENFHYNPVTLAQYALSAHAKGDTNRFLEAADKLTTLEGPDGALRYMFTYQHYTKKDPYQPGWVSGMAQGQALSVFARAYAATTDKKYLQAGKAAIDFLQVKHPSGPMTDMSDLDPTLTGYIFFQEYITEPHVYTLNGYLFTLLGLYDWWKLTDSGTAGQLFQSGIDTLVHILPYYDLGTLSAYDLSYLTVASLPGKEGRVVLPHVIARYHAIHIQLLSALGSVVHEPVLAKFERRWRKAVE